MKLTEIQNIISIVSDGDLIISDGYIYAPNFAIKQDLYKPANPILFRKDQFALFTEQVSFKNLTATIKRKTGSKMEIPGTETELEVPQFKGSECKIDLSKAYNLDTVGKELFVAKNFVSTASSQKIAYYTAKNDGEYIVSSTICKLLEVIKEYKISKNENGLIITGKGIKAIFPFVSSDISISNIDSVIKGSSIIGKVKIDEELLKEILSLPTKEEEIAFTKDSVKVSTSILNYQSKIHSKGTVDAKVQLCNIEPINQFEVTKNCIKYTTESGISKLIPFVG